MAIKPDYVLRETGSNLRRNFTLTVATVLTVAVSLALAGASLLIRQGVDNATQRWRGGIEVIVFLEPDVTAEQRAAVARSLEENAEVKRTTYFDKNRAYEEFKDLYKDSTIVDIVTPEEMPPSYRVVPQNPEATLVDGFRRNYQAKPGVFKVVAATDAIRTMQRLSGILSTGMLAIAVSLLLASALLIINTIRTAMFARRREIEVMKLVGATNWFIRVPFMLEGLIHGMLGAGIAVGAVIGLNWLFETKLAAPGPETFALLQDFAVNSGDVLASCILVVVVGMAVGVIGSGVAVTRFLDV